MRYTEMIAPIVKAMQEMNANMRAMALELGATKKRLANWETLAAEKGLSLPEEKNDDIVYEDEEEQEEQEIDVDVSGGANEDDVHVNEVAIESDDGACVTQ